MIVSRLERSNVPVGGWNTKIQNYFWSGVGKRDDEIKEALQQDILMLNLESEEEMMRVEAMALELGAVARISIRVNPNIGCANAPIYLNRLAWK